jgi:hypothetical protein
MRRMIRFLPIAIATATIALALGCGGGDGQGGPDVGDVPQEGLQDLPDGIEDGDITPRPDVPGDLLPDTEIPGDDGGDLVPCDAAESIAKGREWLENAEPGFARNAFDEAVAICPDDVEARFGAALSEMIYGSEQFVSALTVLSGQGTGPQLAAVLPVEGDEDASQNEILAVRLHTVFMGLRAHFDRGLAHLEALEGRDVEFQVEAVPVYLGIKPTLLFRGTFDEGDVLLMRAVGSLIVGIFDTLAGQDFNSDILSIVYMVRGGMDSDLNFPTISRFVAYLLAEDSRFFTLHPGDGAMLFADARKRFADVGPLLDAAIEQARLHGAGPGEVSFVEDQAGAAVLNVRSMVKRAEDGTTTEEPWYLVLSDTTMQAFRDASRSIRTPGDRVTLHGGVLPVMAAVVGGFVRVGLLDVVGIKMPGGLDLNALEVDDLLGVLKGLLPNLMAFDWGAFYETGVGLRAWMPAYTEDRPGMDNILLADWECPADLAADGFPSGSLRMLCAKAAVLTDGPHFAGTSYATQADGTASGFPVLAFPDPTLHGLASVDLEGTDGNRDPSAYVAATGTTLNAALANMLVGLLTFLK